MSVTPYAKQETQLFLVRSLSLGRKLQAELISFSVWLRCVAYKQAVVVVETTKRGIEVLSFVASLVEQQQPFFKFS